MADGAPLLELDGVSKRFGPVQALDRVDFTVNEGEVVVLVGDNGAGKVPSVALEPVAVTKDNVKSTVIADEFVTAKELCTGAYAQACKEAGISG
jgi:ABC-type branched-subunit amino acid transport system ATPase component